MDRDLVLAAQRGDREAFAILARTHGDRLYAVAQRILRDAGLAEDALQQTLVTAWMELPALRDPERFLAWAMRIVVHEAYAVSRGRSRMNAQIRVLPVEGASPHDDMAGIADRDQLERGFRRLPEDQRAILVLRHYLGLEPAEIAETLGLAPGTVRSRLHYAHRAMRAALEADERSSAASGGTA